MIDQFYAVSRNYLAELHFSNCELGAKVLVQKFSLSSLRPTNCSLDLWCFLGQTRMENSKVSARAFSRTVSESYTLSFYQSYHLVRRLDRALEVAKEMARESACEPARA